MYIELDTHTGSSSKFWGHIPFTPLVLAWLLIILLLLSGHPHLHNKLYATLTMTTGDTRNGSFQPRMPKIFLAFLGLPVFRKIASWFIPLKLPYQIKNGNKQKVHFQPATRGQGTVADGWCHLMGRRGPARTLSFLQTVTANTTQELVCHHCLHNSPYHPIIL